MMSTHQAAPMMFSRVATQGLSSSFAPAIRRAATATGTGRGSVNHHGFMAKQFLPSAIIATTATRQAQPTPTSSSSSSLLLDAQDMEHALQVLTRPGARDILESYIQSLEHEAAAQQERQEQDDEPITSFEEWKKSGDYVTEGAWY